MRKPHCRRLFCHSSLPTLSGELARTPTFPHIVQEAQLAEKRLCLPWEVVSVLALMLLAPFVSLLLGVVSMPSVAVLVDGPSLVVGPVCLDKRGFLLFIVLWHAR